MDSLSEYAKRAQEAGARFTDAPLQMTFTRHLGASQQELFDYISDTDRLSEWIPGAKQTWSDDSNAKAPKQVGSVRMMKSSFGKPTPWAWSRASRTRTEARFFAGWPLRARQGPSSGWPARRYLKWPLAAASRRWSESSPTADLPGDHSCAQLTQLFSVTPTCSCTSHHRRRQTVTSLQSSRCVCSSRSRDYRNFEHLRGYSPRGTLSLFF